MLSSAVVRQQDGIPGDGFFVLAVDLKKLGSNATEQEKIQFWQNELQETYRQWA